MNIINVNLTYGNMTYGNKPKEKIVHHIEAEGSMWTVQAIHNMHVNDNGWAAIGYHYYIRLDGSIYKGRPDNAIGSHCKGANSNTLGIAFEGNYDKRTEMPAAQYNAWCELSDYLDSVYGKMKTYGHRERGSSECPGKYFPLDKVKNCTPIQAVKGTWEVNKDGWWFKYSDGSWATGWAKLPYNNTDNTMTWFLFDDKGYMLTSWQKDGGNWYLLDDKNGDMKTGWYYKDGKWYYMNKDGVMQTGWIKLDNTWYYLNSNGSMATGWINVKGKDYLLYSNGSMAHDCTLYGYTFDSNGVATKQ